jgi:hypothetical protein
MSFVKFLVAGGTPKRPTVREGQIWRMEDGQLVILFQVDYGTFKIFRIDETKDGHMRLGSNRMSDKRFSRDQEAPEEWTYVASTDDELELA